MKKIIKKNGFSLLNLIVMLTLFAVVGIFGFQIGMGYINQNSIRGAVKSALIEAKSNDNATINSVEGNIEKKLSVSTIDISTDNISVTKEEDGFEVNIDYIKEINITDKIKIVMNLGFTEHSK